MKISFAFLLMFLSKVCFSQCDNTSTLTANDSTIVAFIRNLPTDKYKGETIASFMSHDVIKEYCDKIFIQEIVGVLAGVQLTYKGFVAIRLFISKDNCKNFSGRGESWDFKKIRSCKIYRIEIKDFSDTDHYLNLVVQGYDMAERLKNDRSDSMDQIVLVKDSVYENVYSPIREQIVKSWILEGDTSLMSSWFRFLNLHRYGDDALDAKYLTISFLKRPSEFVRLLKKEESMLKKNISDYMLSSSGFMLAAYELNTDFDKSVALFRKLMK